MPSLTLYDFWLPEKYPPTILIAGDREIYTLFKDAFPDYDTGTIWKPTSPKQYMYDYGFYIKGAVESDRNELQVWLEKYRTDDITLLLIENEMLDHVYALSYHDSNLRVCQLVQRAKPYERKVNDNMRAAALQLVEIVLDAVNNFQKTDYLVAVPYIDKDFDFPEFLTETMCKKTEVMNGSSFVFQTRKKEKSQKELDSIEEKRKNVDGLFAVKDNHPFSGKVITIIDDIYRSGTTIAELAKVIREAGAKTVQALVLTKTFRD